MYSEVAVEGKGGDGLGRFEDDVLPQQVHVLGWVAQVELQNFAWFGFGNCPRLQSM